VSESLSSSKSFVAEIIGPAGSGKTSLSILLGGSEDIRTGLSLWRWSPGPLLAGSFWSLPNLISLCYSRKRFGWHDVKLIIQLNALLRAVRQESAKGYDALLLDEGTVFALAKLLALGHGGALTGQSDQLMQGLFDRLAQMLDAIIWLDAPDEVLVQRIRERAKPHIMKYESDAEIQDHLAFYRSSFERVVSELSKRNGLKVFRFNTDQEPLEAIAAKVLLQTRIGA
jgi:hypothetical protein